MTQEDKNLLLKDLCARLPYGVICLISNRSASITEELKIGGLEAFEVGSLEVKPYLRPMSSMTEEEKIELCIISYAPDEMRALDEKLYVIQTNANNSTDWLNEHNFDYRGLIEKRLALEAPADMYKND